MSDNGDRPRLSWKEIDQRRDGARSRSDGSQRPKNRHEEARAEVAAQQYLKEIDKMFSGEKGGAEGELLAKEVRDAHGSPELDRACKAYREALGLPADPGLLSIFLDVNDSSLVADVLEHMLALQRAGRLEVTSGLRAQLRVLAQAFDDSVAGAAEDLLEAE